MIAWDRAWYITFNGVYTIMIIIIIDVYSHNYVHLLLLRMHNQVSAPLSIS